MTRAAASMREQRYAGRRRRHPQVAIQQDGIYLDSYRLMRDRQARGSLAGSRLVHVAPFSFDGQRAGASCVAAASSRLRTSSSLVCENSSYHRLTALNTEGVRMNTTSSAS